MKSFLIYSVALSVFALGQSTYANDSTVQLSRKCFKDNPLVVGETDSNLLTIYSQVCDKKNEALKNNLLIQAAQRLQAIGQDFKALQLVNSLHSQNIQSTSLTDVQFLAGTAIANKSITQMRTKELRYLSSEQTYPAGKDLIVAIERAKPAVVLPTPSRMSTASSEVRAPVRATRKQNSTPKAATKARTNTAQVKTNPPQQKPAKAAAPVATKSNPFATLK